MDKLDFMFNKQIDLQERLGNIERLKGNDVNIQQFINQMILAVHEEATEIMKETAYKNPDFVPFGWKKTQVWNVEAYKEEIVDLFHFLMNLCIAVEMDSEEFFNIYCKKNKINFERQDNGY
jgi:dimeric dUTPase (all-alpha-NTP-PPase superfamily)